MARKSAAKTAPATPGKLNLIDLSQIVAGMLYQGRIAPSSIRPEALVEPYPALVALYQKRKRAPSEEDIVEVIGPMAFETAREAAERALKLPVNWAALLEKAANRYEAGRILDKMAKRLMEGEEVDLLPLHSIITRLDRGEARLIQLSQIKPSENPFVEIGYEPVDYFMGGLPEDSLTIIGGRPGIGKTWLMMKLAEKYALKAKRKAAIYSLEMTAQQFAYRAMTVSKMSKKATDLLYICDDILSYTEISQISSRLPEGELGMICVDFAELLVEGDASMVVQVMDTITRSLAKLAQRLHVMVVLLSQLNRGEGMGADRLRYSGEAPAAMILNLINPGQSLDGSSDDGLMLAAGNAGIVQAKSRFGFEMGGPGMVEVPWGEAGWGDEAVKWHSLKEVVAQPKPTPSKRRSRK